MPERDHCPGKGISRTHDFYLQLTGSGLWVGPGWRSLPGPAKRLPESDALHRAGRRAGRVRPLVLSRKRSAPPPTRPLTPLPASGENVPLMSNKGLAWVSTVQAYSLGPTAIYAGRNGRHSCPAQRAENCESKSASGADGMPKEGKILYLQRAITALCSAEFAALGRWQQNGTSWAIRGCELPKISHYGWQVVAIVLCKTFFWCKSTERSEVTSKKYKDKKICFLCQCARNS